MSDSEDDEIKRQKELLEFYARKKKQEEADIAMAKSLQTQLSAPSTTTTTATTTTATTTADDATSTTPASGTEKRPLTDSDFARQLYDEEKRALEAQLKAATAASSDADLARRLYEDEKKALQNRHSAENEWEREVASLKKAAQLEAQDKIEKAKQEKERLKRELQKLEMDRLKNEGQIATKSLQGVAFPDHWQKQTKDLQKFDVRRGSAEWNRVANRFNTTAPGQRSQE
eukprot:TRINITY_DN4207_c0_g1_i1.p1 TRINITY_DN4207_c0_g1~~TRINITY_DN4207_c0_g1_i1.p1  ORF type:complete len:230 (-),score=69.28 TRINITY_DN4207_c0_g1_i1:418-1107(-)